MAARRRLRDGGLVESGAVARLRRWSILQSDPADRRGFADASLVFGGLSREQMVQNRAFLEPLPEGAELLTPPPFVEPPRLRAFAAIATWGGLILEGLIAIACLTPPRAWLDAARHALLITFCFTTYALAPVAGFGWLLATM